MVAQQKGISNNFIFSVGEDLDVSSIIMYHWCEHQYEHFIMNY